MSCKSSASLAAASLAMLATVSETAAGGRALECFEPVRRPALYDTVYEDVMVSPGGQLRFPPRAFPPIASL